MKLRNKKTGEVETCEAIMLQTDIRADDYNSLAELNEEWEDYKPAEKKPRRYRLVKDLPTFDKGDEFYIAQTGALWYDGGGDDDVCAYATGTLIRFPNILEDWFEPIDDEDINTPNIGPLIKDEKIRKAVRAWAEANGVNCTRIVGVRTLRCEHQGISIEFNADLFVGYVTALKTIAELCGEEDEK